MKERGKYQIQKNLLRWVIRTIKMYLLPKCQANLVSLHVDSRLHIVQDVSASLSDSSVEPHRAG